MRRAADLLADPAQRVRQVGFAVGYQDANYFGKAFRKYFGETPGSFRSRLLAARRKELP
jgi:AraC-like DNA-binding protein